MLSYDLQYSHDKVWCIIHAFWCYLIHCFCNYSAAPLWCGAWPTTIRDAKFLSILQFFFWISGIYKGCLYISKTIPSFKLAQHASERVSLCAEMASNMLTELIMFRPFQAGMGDMTSIKQIFFWKYLQHLQMKVVYRQHVYSTVLFSVYLDPWCEIWSKITGLDMRYFAWCVLVSI